MKAKLKVPTCSPFAPKTIRYVFLKKSPSQLQILILSTVEPDANHARQNIAEDNLQGLVNSIQKVGVIHPIVVRPANVAGRYTVVVGERRRQAALLAGEKRFQRWCADVCRMKCSVQVFENIGLGVRSALAPRDMAHADSVDDQALFIAG